MLKAISVHFAATCTAVQVSDTTMPGEAPLPDSKKFPSFFQGCKDNRMKVCKSFLSGIPSEEDQF
jgi:hypothetical protein